MDESEEVGEIEPEDERYKESMNMFKTMRRSSVVLVIFTLLLALSAVAYAITALFYKSPTQTSDYTPGVYFEFDISDAFTESGEVGPGQSMSINPVISSNASVDMYCFIKVEMPTFGEGGLYTLTPGSGWSMQTSGVQGDRWVGVYRYDSVLTPGNSTRALSSALTMVEMGMAEYVEIDDLNVSMTGYACGTEDLELENAWAAISAEYGA